MRSEKYKQVVVISEDNAEEFQDKMNSALSKVADPEIVFDSNRSFTAYVTYKVSKDVPESVLELLELVADERHYCEECPHFVISDDKRIKWGSCSLKQGKARPDSRACEHFYIWRMRQLERIAADYKEIPFEIVK